LLEKEWFTDYSYSPYTLRHPSFNDENECFLIGIDKILRLFNPKEYFDKEKYNPTINKGVDKNDKKTTF